MSLPEINVTRFRKVDQLRAELQELISRVPPCVVHGDAAGVALWKKNTKEAKVLITGCYRIDVLQACVRFWRDYHKKPGQKK